MIIFVDSEERERGKVDEMQSTVCVNPHEGH